MVRVTVPATSANMGSGYDSIGIALELYNVIDLAENDHIDISDKNGQYVPQDESNLIYQCAKRVYDECGKPLSGLTIVEDCAIPQTRGLGSSSACTVAASWVQTCCSVSRSTATRSLIWRLPSRVIRITPHRRSSAASAWRCSKTAMCITFVCRFTARSTSWYSFRISSCPPKGACGAAQDHRPSRCGLQSGARSAARGQPDHRQAGKP